MPRLGILGGTFDPVHLGHLASAHDTAVAFELSRVLLVLSARPPHKRGTRPASIEDRLQMLRLAAAEDPLFAISDIEVRRSGPSYMSDTLVELSHERPGDELFLILGADAYDLIDTWHRPERLLERANLIVTSRPGEPTRSSPLLPPVAARVACCYDPRIGCYVHQSGHVLRAHQIDGLDISASQVREFIARRSHAETAARVEELARFTGRDVAEYITRKSLYETPASRAS
ncbi:MAG: nicotinate (nicotinamide) nucleotide adenylyltransferase [Candidatus Binatia bacterium]